MAAKLLASFACVIVATSAIAVPTSYAVGSLPVAKYAVPWLPIQKYAVPSLQVQKYAVPSLQVQKYATPILAAAPVSKLAYAEPEAPAHYSFEYSVQDQHSGDVKQQKESRQGDAVQGYYSLVQPDGVQRIVEYTADKVHGFNAVVRYEGQPIPAPVTKVAYAHAPIPKVAYAPAPVQKLAYAPAPLAYSHGPAPLAYAPAPVAKLAYAAAPGAVAYAAPAKIAYSQNLGHVSFSSPSFSYQH